MKFFVFCVGWLVMFFLFFFNVVFLDDICFLLNNVFWGLCVWIECVVFENCFEVIEWLLIFVENFNEVWVVVLVFMFDIFCLFLYEVWDCICFLFFCVNVVLFFIWCKVELCIDVVIRLIVFVLGICVVWLLFILLLFEYEWIF